MKNALFTIALLGALCGCGSKGGDPAPAVDPFLGHWQSQALRSIKYNPDGTVATDDTRAIKNQLDVTATTLTFTTVQPDGKTSVEVDTYIRSGEDIVITPTKSNSTPSTETIFVRSLTTATFTLEFNQRRVAGKTYYIQSVPYRR